MKFSTFFGFATLLTGAFALPAVQEQEAAVAFRADLISTLTTEVDTVLDLVDNITTGLDKALTDGNVIELVPQLTDKLLSVNGTLATVIGTLEDLSLTGSVTDLSTLLGFGLSTVGTVIKLLGTLIHTLTTLISTLTSVPALEKELASIIDTTVTEAPSALASVVKSIINFLPTLGQILAKL